MKITEKYLFFWGGILSNFHECELNYLDKTFKSSEQLFMYLKAITFKDDKIANEILNVKTPKEAKKLGRQISNFDDKIWNSGRENIMISILQIKYQQCPEFKKLLNENKDKIFVEASPYDSIWGIGMNENDPNIEDESKWRGLNLLGKCINKLIKYERPD